MEIYPLNRPTRGIEDGMVGMRRPVGFYEAGGGAVRRVFEAKQAVSDDVRELQERLSRAAAEARSKRHFGF